MNESRYFCPNACCDDYRVRGKGNISIHFEYGKYGDRIIYCKSCKERFSSRKLSPYHESKYSPEQQIQIFNTYSKGFSIRKTAELCGGLDKDGVNRTITNIDKYCEDALLNLLYDLGLTTAYFKEFIEFLNYRTLPRMIEQHEIGTQYKRSKPVLNHFLDGK